MKGDVSVNVKFECNRCGTLFDHPIRSQFSIWANRKIRSMEECIDVNEVPFPPSVGYLDITQVTLQENNPIGMEIRLWQCRLSKSSQGCCCAGEWIVQALLFLQWMVIVPDGPCSKSHPHLFHVLKNLDSLCVTNDISDDSNEYLIRSEVFPSVSVKISAKER